MGLEMSQQQLAQATAAAGLAGEQISGGELRAPFAGVVTSVGCEEGEFFNTMGMSPTGGSPVLVSLVNLDTIRVDVEASDRDVGRLAEGMRARIRVDSVADQLSDAGIEGTVEYVSLAADPMTRTFPVRVVADNPEHVIRAGMHARVRLVLERRDAAMYVPDEAVRETEGQSYVMVAQGTVARRRPVETGLVGDQGTEITTGLQAGELVVVAGNFGLPDEALIEVAQ
jgi:RND family efflux transporter MFP subunit